MKRLLPLLTRTTPLMVRRLFLPTVFALNIMFFQQLPTLKCTQDSLNTSQAISYIDSNVIMIEVNGTLVGQAFCFAENYLVSVSTYFTTNNDNKPSKNYQFIKNGRKLQGTFREVGQFENLTFFERTSSSSEVTLRPLQADQGNDPYTIFPVQIFLKKDYPSVRNGFIVAKDEGYGIVDGRGDLGSLIIKNGKAAGIVTQVGRDLESGFLRFIQWKDLPTILRYLKTGKKMQLGISAQAKPFKEGIQVVRIAPNSSLAHSLMMGDTILKANGHKIREVEALQRVAILSEGHLTLEVLRDEELVEVSAQIKQ